MNFGFMTIFPHESVNPINLLNDFVLLNICDLSGNTFFM